MTAAIDLERPRRLIPSGALLVELAGTPGAGKTTGLAGVHKGLRSEGWLTFDPATGARTMAYRTLLGRVVAALPGDRLRHILAWRVYLLHRLLGAVRVVARRPRHFLWVVVRQLRRSSQARVGRRRVIHWYLRMTGAQEFYRRHARTGEAIVFDEGYVHRVVQLFSSPVDRAPAESVRRYLTGVPRPDLLIRVGAPPLVCLDRIRERGVWERLEDLPDEALDRFIYNAESVIDDAFDHVRKSGWNVVEVRNHDTGRSRFESAMMDAVRRGLAQSTERSIRTTSLRLTLPRPGHFAALARGRLGPVGLTTETVDAFLDWLGTDRRGRVYALPLARRSASVQVETGLGRLVVRGYPDHWPEESLHHEHSLLRVLETVGYPSPRLVPSSGGQTVHRCNGRRLAAYRFEVGRNLSGSFLPPALRIESHHLAGRLLSSLHEATAEIRLPGGHHLAMEGDGAKRLAAQLELLEDLASRERPGSLDPLESRAGEVADRLARLHSSVVRAAPPVAIIHGDFGLHNMLLRRDGSATVVDFELARRDWCLVDIVEALGAMSEEGGRAFLSGYVLQNGEVPGGWSLLSVMWEYHRLAGAIRAWESYQTRGAQDRLTVVRRRLEEADRVAERGTAGWV